MKIGCDSYLEILSNVETSEKIMKYFCIFDSRGFFYKTYSYRKFDCQKNVLVVK